jgi:hypothetical protein
MKTITEYECDICATRFAFQSAAEKCEARGLDKKLANVGDIVTVTAGYGWYDGDRGWVTNPNIELRPKRPASHDQNCFDRCCTYEFFYVVTAIDAENHRRHYHLVTLAMSGRQGHRSGWTSMGHYRPKIVMDPPDYVIETSKSVIGETAENLL